MTASETRHYLVINPFTGEIYQRFNSYAEADRWANEVDFTVKIIKDKASNNNG
jgi:uncharacterized protein YeaC (DUF1315 family)